MPASHDDLLQNGRNMVAAGYIIYGSGTVFVLSIKGYGVHGFTLDPLVGAFFLSHPDIHLDDFARVYSVNEGYAAQWDPKLRAYIESLKEGEKTWRARYIGSLVADFHRNLLKGGIFLYPGTLSNPQGKLRLLYEGFPMAFIAEAAGGRATDGYISILDKQPKEHHQRTPLFVGNSKNIEELMGVLNDDD